MDAWEVIIKRTRVADGIFEYIGVKRPILMIGSLNSSCILLDRPALQTSPHHVALKHAGISTLKVSWSAVDY